MKNTAIDELLQAGVIDELTADRIRSYWQSKQGGNPNRLSIVFSVLGALLAGLGVILVVAHNWDDLPHAIRTILAFVPMLIGHLAAWYALKKKPESRAWREGAAVFLLFAVGACLAMVSQIYHIEGELKDFLFSWILLAIPIMFVMDSALAALFYGIGISWFAAEIGYFNRSQETPYAYLPFLGFLVIFYWHIRQTRPNSNYQHFLDWLIPLSLCLTLGTFSDDAPAYMWLAYMVMLALLYVVGKWVIPNERSIRANGWLVVGLFGSFILLFIQSFLDFWIYSKSMFLENWMEQNELWLFVGLWLLLLALLVYYGRKNQELWRHPLSYLGVVYPLIYLLGQVYPLAATIIINSVLFFLGLFHIWMGAKRDHLGILNFGMLVITILVACRFFDTDMTFALRGLLFLLLGGGFFLANNYLLSRRKEEIHNHEN